MTLYIPTTAWILTLAVAYLVVIYSLLWFAKRTGSERKRSLF